MVPCKWKDVLKEFVKRNIKIIGLSINDVVFKYLHLVSFQTADKDFWCARPQNMQNMNVSEWRNLTQPSSACSIWDLDYSAMDSIHTLFDYLQSPQLPLNYTQCTQFEFGEPDEEQAMTLVQEFGLVCSKRQLLSVVEMCFLAGAAVGSVSSGWISDRFGRKHTLMGFAFLQTTFGKYCRRIRKFI